MKRIPIAEVLSALDLQIAIGAILIGKDMDADEIATLYHSDSPGDEEKLNTLKTERKILYFFSEQGCPVLANTYVDCLLIDRVYIVKLV